MSELAIDEPDATIVTDFVHDQTNIKQKPWKFCNYVVFMFEMIFIFI